MIAANHLEMLRTSAVPEDWAAEAGVVSVTSKAELPECFHYLDGQAVPGVLFPWHSAEGPIVPQYRPDKPQMNGQGKTAKYLWQTGKPPVLQVLPSQRPRLADKDKKILLVEGTKQTLAAAAATPDDAPWVVVGLTGCWGWSSDGKPIPDMTHIPWADRHVVLVFDADVTDNPQVWDAADQLTQVLDVIFGIASITYGVLPANGKAGLDDVLAAAPDREAALRRIVDKAMAGLGRRPAEPGNPWMNKSEVLAEAAANEVRRRVPVLLSRDRQVAVYTNGVYRFEPERVRAVLTDMLKNRYTPTRANTVIEFLTSVLHREGVWLPERSEHLLINCANGMLDPTTLELHPHDPKYKSRFQLPVEWNEDAVCPRYEKWAADVVGDQLDDLEEAASQMLEWTRTPSKALFVYGPTRSGKSTFLRLLVKVVGPQNYSSVTLHQLSDNRFAAADLYGSLLNMAAELSATHIEDVSLFKNLSGDDPITGDKKYGKRFGFTNQALFGFAMNMIPTVGESSRAYLERVKPFHFGNSFAGAEDPAIEAAMVKEIEGIFRRLVLALQRRLARGRFLDTDPDVAGDFSEASDRVRQWMAERAEKVEKPMGTPGADLLADFKVWSAANEMRPLGRNSFYRRLDSAGVERYDGGTGTWFRLKLKESKPQFSGFSPVPTPNPSPISPPSTNSLSSCSKGRGEEQPKTGNSGSNTEVSTAIDPVPAPQNDRSAEVHPSFLSTTGLFHLDIETASADKIYSGGHVGPFPRLFGVRSPGFDAITTADPDEFLRVISAILAETANTLVTHNGWAFDLPALAHHLGMDYEALMLRTRDLRVEAFLASPPIRTKGANRSRYDLDHLGATLAGMPKSKGLDQLKRQYGGYDKIPVDDPKYHEYLKRDLEVTAAVAGKLGACNPDYLEHERLVSTIAGRLSLIGLRMDEDLLARRVASRAAEKAVIVEELIEHFGFPKLNAAGKPAKNPWAVKTATEAFDRVMPEGFTWPRAKGGVMALREGDFLQDVIEEYGPDHPAGKVALLVDQAQAGNSFVDQSAANIVNGRIHPQYSTLTATGRWASSKPNVMGVGKRTSVLLADRDLVLAEPGESFVSIDLSGIDARCVAGLSGDTAYARLFEPGVDIHNEMAVMFFGDVAMRDPAKAVSHGINYGRQARNIAAQTRRPVEEVAELHRRYFERFPGIAEWHSRVRTIGAASGDLHVGSGRVVRVAPSEAFTEAPARLAQAAARDLAMRGLLALEAAGMGGMLRLFIHDEVCLSVPEGREREIADRAAALMSFDWESPSGLVIPIVAEPGKGFGPRWGDCYQRREW